MGCLLFVVWFVVDLVFGVCYIYCYWVIVITLILCLVCVFVWVGVVWALFGVLFVGCLGWLVWVGGLLGLSD